MHFQEALYPGQGSGGATVYPRKTRCEVGEFTVDKTPV